MRFLKYKVIDMFENIVQPEGRITRRRFFASILIWSFVWFLALSSLIYFSYLNTPANDISTFGYNKAASDINQMLDEMEQGFFIAGGLCLIGVIMLTGLSKSYVKRLADIDKSRKLWIYPFYILLAQNLLGIFIFWGPGFNLLYSVISISGFLGSAVIGLYALCYWAIVLYFFCLTLALLVWPGTPDNQLRGTNG